ncbi:ATP-dependent helicase HrpB [Paenibacillus sp. F411]|uniref:ATP-dependent helicase HrpB n=1 Tax=Paenibacillus sp. F411 TaxID=2820239 RepID=UPI001AAEFA9E|nr:ATP-dependent helicase HrpB [Paenibacillus sp. F411]MBO2944190.1 ATP-dependent helicase HrpB [Paenibacillus sp. F411]
MKSEQLPIDQILPTLLHHFRDNTSGVLIAEPGAGKTTRVPLAFLTETWLKGHKIIMLEPRRLAARSAAAFMANALGEAVGARIGYRVRADSRVSPETVIEVVTEGVLTRMLQEDPELTGVGMIIFDEFHERNLHGDLGLALALECQSVLREDLRLLVMSATMEAEPVSRLLGGAEIITCSGRSYPVETFYMPPPSGQALEVSVAAAIIRSLHETSGDILVFLPGMKEIERTGRALRSAGLPEHAVVRQLHSRLRQPEQELAVAPDAAGRRKIILSTSISETSLTIPGVTAVVDSGWMRTEEYSRRTGLPQLVTRRVSRASADQRQGRAGRVQAGACYRLWSPEEHAALQIHTPAEILRSDLSSLTLELAVWGIQDLAELHWLDEPPSASMDAGRELLSLLQAVDAAGKVTPHGRSLAKLGLHPRLAHMLIKGKELGQGSLACLLAAFLQEKESGADTGGNPDLAVRIERLIDQLSRDTADSSHNDGTPWSEISREMRRLMSKLNVKPVLPMDADGSSLLLAFAYPDRIAVQREQGHFVLRSGRGAVFRGDTPLARLPLITAAVVDDRGTTATIQAAASLELHVLERHFKEQLYMKKIVNWHEEAGRIKAVQAVMLGHLKLSERMDPHPDEAAVIQAVVGAVRREGLGLLSWSTQSLQWKQRMQFMSSHNTDWPSVDDEALRDTLEEWLAPYLSGVRSRQDLKKLKAGELLAHKLSWDQRQKLEEWAPTHIQVPSGSRIPIQYEDPAAPYVEVRLQEVFGLQQTPRLGASRTPLTFHLLSPARRPVQITKDLESFWQHAYFDIKKDLKGRYPKHYWPENPLEAEATNKVKPRTSR